MTDAGTEAAGLSRKPFSTGAALSEAANAFSARAPLYLLLTAAVWLPYLYWLRGELAGRVYIVEVNQYSALSALLKTLEPAAGLLAVSWLNTVLLLLAALPVMCGRPVNLAETARRGTGQLLPLAVIGICMGLTCLAVLAGVVLTGAVLSSLIRGSLHDAGSLAAGLVLIALGMTLYVRWCLALAACTCEECGPLGSLRRSAELSSGYRWRLFRGFAALYLAFLIFGLFVKQMTAGLNLYVQFMIAGTLSAVYFAHFAMFIAVCYRDLRGGSIAPPNT